MAITQIEGGASNINSITRGLRRKFPRIPQFQPLEPDSIKNPLCRSIIPLLLTLARISPPPSSSQMQDADTVIAADKAIDLLLHRMLTNVASRKTTLSILNELAIAAPLNMDAIAEAREIMAQGLDFASTVQLIEKKLRPLIRVLDYIQTHSRKMVYTGLSSAAVLPSIATPPPQTSSANLVSQIVYNSPITPPSAPPIKPELQVGCPAFIPFTGNVDGTKVDFQTLGTNLKDLGWGPDARSAMQRFSQEQNPMFLDIYQGKTVMLPRAPDQPCVQLPDKSASTNVQVAAITVPYSEVGAKTEVYSWFKRIAEAASADPTFGKNPEVNLDDLLDFTNAWRAAKRGENLEAITQFLTKHPQRLTTPFTEEDLNLIFEAQTFRNAGLRSGYIHSQVSAYSDRMSPIYNAKDSIRQLFLKLGGFDHSTDARITNAADELARDMGDIHNRDITWRTLTINQNIAVGHFDNMTTIYAFDNSALTARLLESDVIYDTAYKSAANTITQQLAKAPLNRPIVVIAHNPEEADLIRLVLADASQKMRLVEVNGLLNRSAIIVMNPNSPTPSMNFPGEFEKSNLIDKALRKIKTSTQDYIGLRRQFAESALAGGGNFPVVITFDPPELLPPTISTRVWEQAKLTTRAIANKSWEKLPEIVNGVLWGAFLAETGYINWNAYSGHWADAPAILRYAMTNRNIFGDYNPDMGYAQNIIQEIISPVQVDSFLQTKGVFLSDQELRSLTPRDIYHFLFGDQHFTIARGDGTNQPGSLRQTFNTLIQTQNQLKNNQSIGVKPAFADYLKNTPSDQLKIDLAITDNLFTFVKAKQSGDTILLEITDPISGEITTVDTNTSGTYPIYTFSIVRDDQGAVVKMILIPAQMTIEDTSLWWFESDKKISFTVGDVSRMIPVPLK